MDNVFSPDHFTEAEILTNRAVVDERTGFSFATLRDPSRLDRGWLIAMRHGVETHRTEIYMAPMAVAELAGRAAAA